MVENQEKIKNYIEGQLSDNDRRLFEKLIASDPDLAVEVQLFRDLKTVIQHEDLYQLKQKLQDTVANMPIEPDFSADFDTDSPKNESDTEGGASSKIRKRLGFGLFAIGILFTITAFFWFKNKETQRVQNMAQQVDFQYFENIIQYDSTDTRPLARALQAYNMKAYSEAENLFIQHCKNHPDDSDALFYLGNCQGITGQFDAATKTFEQMTKSTNSPLIIPARWHLVICYLKIGDYNKARPLLVSLKTDALWGDKARQILEHLD
jgi:TolA-binding protein